MIKFVEIYSGEGFCSVEISRCHYFDSKGNLRVKRKRTYDKPSQWIVEKILSLKDSWGIEVDDGQLIVYGFAEF